MALVAGPSLPLRWKSSHGSRAATPCDGGCAKAFTGASSGKSLAFAALCAGRVLSGSRHQQQPNFQHHGVRRRQLKIPVSDGTAGFQEVEKNKGLRELRPIDDLISWLSEIGTEGLDGLRIAPSTEPGRGLGVFATRNFEVGELVCKVPEAGILTSSKDADPSCPLEVSLAKRLLEERHLGSKSSFAPYINSLPPPLLKSLAPAHPLFWPPGIDFNRLLAGSPHGRRLAAEALEAASANIEALLAAGVARDKEEACWALAVVDSRSFTFQPDTPDEQLALVPLLDMLNTSTLVEDNHPGWQCSFEPDGSVEEGAALVTEKAVQIGEEVLHMYSTNSSAMLWMVYGFLEDGQGQNLFEMAGLEVDVEKVTSRDDAALQKAKQQALAGIDFHDNHILIELPHDAETHGNLMPVARILSCSSVEEVNRVLPHLRASILDGQKPVDSGIELELSARSLVSELLCEACRRSDDELARLRSSETGELERLAIILLTREKPVLDLELHATKTFCAGAAEALQGDDESGKRFKDELWDDETGWMGAG